MIYSISSFLNELDILEMRLSELSGVVDLFYLIESNTTHRGNPKPFLIQENWERFKPWHNQIRYITVEDMPQGGLDEIEMTIERERHQYGYCRKALPRVKTTDTVLLSDVDEIPRVELVANYEPKKDGIVALGLDLYCFYLNFKSKRRWYLPVLVSGACYNAIPPHLHRRLSPDCFYPNQENGMRQSIPNAGWHFTYVCPMESARFKLENYLHWNVKHTLAPLLALQNGETPEIVPVEDFDFVPINEDLPAYVQRNEEKLRAQKLIH